MSIGAVWTARLTALAALVATPSFALDCGKATTGVEKLICSDAKLRRADQAMSDAYFKLLSETRDPEFREALIRSQRSWLKARSAGPDRFGAAENDTTSDADALLAMTEARRADLDEGRPIRRMKRQRAIAEGASGGAYTGLHVDCFIMPPPYGAWDFSCYGSLQAQNGDRVCSTEVDWASGHTTDYRLVGVAHDGKLNPLASCSIGYAETDEPCPGSDRPNPHWNTHPRFLDSSPPASTGLEKYNADFDLPDDAWMRDCLVAPSYPPPELSHPD